MPSQTDYDQGGTSRQWVRTYMGPSVGWVDLPGLIPLATITVAGTYILQPNTTIVQVNCAGVVIITLPTVLEPPVPALTQPALYSKVGITIVDIGGNAGAHPITIKPASVAETILGLTQIQITSNYGGFSLHPSSTQKGWTNPQ
jgi:hypothetical protein